MKDAARFDFSGFGISYFGAAMARSKNSLTMLKLSVNMGYTP